MKKLLSMLVVLVVLLAGATVLWFKGKPETPSHNPMGTVDVATITSIVVENRVSSMTFENTNGSWRLGPPVNDDELEPSAVERLVAALKAFSVGSIVSENNGNYDRFELRNGEATHVRVYVKGSDKPVLDGYVGKGAANPGDSFFRFEGKKAVYVANELPSYLFKRDLKEYRFSRIFKIDPTSANSIDIKFNNKTWNIVHSSNTWKVANAKSSISDAQIQQIVGKISHWFPVDYGLEKETLATTNPKPYLEMKIKIGDKDIDVNVYTGAPEDPTNRFPGEMRPITVSDRKFVMFMHSSLVNELVDEVKKFK
jgi:hypothetical protein